MSDADSIASEAEALSRKIGKLLAGKGSAVQAAVLADLTATWLHGHRGGSAASSSAFRREIFEHHIRAIWSLVELADEERSS